MAQDRTKDRHGPNNTTATIRAQREWFAKLDGAAQAVSESRMAYIRRAVEERMDREGHTTASTHGYNGE